MLVLSTILSLTVSANGDFWGLVAGGIAAPLTDIQYSPKQGVLMSQNSLALI